MKNELAYPFAGTYSAQETGSGLTKFELAIIHFMTASVIADENSGPDYMTKELARDHARNAIMLANAMFAELESEKGK